MFVRQSPGLAAALGVLFALNVGVALSFAAWAVWGAAPVELRAAAVGLVVYLALVTGPVGAARYRMAAAPILALALPWAWSVLRRRLSPQSPARAV